MLCRVHDYVMIKMERVMHMTNRNKYKNEYSKKHYDRINLQLPKGEKEKIKQMADTLGISVNEYIYKLISEDVALNQSRLISGKFSDEQKSLLQKLQVPKKYFEMIEQCVFDKNKGYYIQLKKGYINDITQSRNIICQTTAEVRTVIPKSHRVREDVIIDGLDAATLEQLKKWQIPKMYYEMIESINTSKTDGHTIVLKPEYTNDFSGSRNIHVDKANAFRSQMKGSHKV